MRNDVKYCMSSYLQYRTIVDQDCRFAEHISPYFYKDNTTSIKKYNSKIKLYRNKKTFYHYIFKYRKNRYYRRL